MTYSTSHAVRTPDDAPLRFALARRMARFCAFLLLCLMITGFALPQAQAQDGDAAATSETEADKGYITRFLQEKLSGAGRQVQIDGFAGALSSRATFTRMTIADDDGVWITLENGSIQWTRSALLAGRVSVQELTAEKIILPRLPGTDPAAPKAETREFALPVLPVGINIQHINVGRVELGEPIIGTAAVFSIDGSLQLSGGEGEAKLAINRVDGPRGQFALDAAFSNETRDLRLNLDLDEDRNGIFVNLVKLDGRPSVKAEIKGEGPLGEYAANLALATDGKPRVTGKLALHPEAQNGIEGNGFRLEMGGDIAALVPPEHKEFFGPSSQLLAEGWRGQNGQLRVPVLMVDTDALNLSGSVTTTDKGAPESAVLLLNLGEDADASSLPVRLPWQAIPTTVQSGSLQLSYDKAQDSRWTLKGRVGDIRRAEGTLSELRLDGRGSVDLTDNALQSVHGWVAFGIDGLVPVDEALARAVGDVVNGGLNFDLRPGNAIEFTGVNINGAHYGLRGDATLDGLASGITLSADMMANYRDLSSLSGLAGRELGGEGTANVRGYYQVLTHSFDAEVQIRGQDIAVSQPHADRLLSGQSRIFVSARRDDTGIELRDLSVNARNLTVKGQGYLNSRAADVQAQIDMPDLSAADPAFAGLINAQAQLTGPTGARKLEVNGKAVDLVTGIADLDAALKGETDLHVAAAQTGDSFELQQLVLSNPQLKIDGGGRFAEGLVDAELDLDVPDLAVFERGLAGGLTATAKATEEAGLRKITVTGLGQDLRLGQSDVEGALPGETRLDLSAEQQGEAFTIKTFTLKNAQMDATASGVISPQTADVAAKLDLRSLASFGRGWRGALQADARFADDAGGGRRLEVTGLGHDLSFGQSQVDGALAGETRLTLNGIERGGIFEIGTATIDNPRLRLGATGKVGKGVTDLAADLRAQDLRFLGRGFRGALDASGTLVETNGNRHVTLKGSANGLAVGNAQADAVLRGTTTFDTAATIDGQNRLSIQSLHARNGQIQISADGSPSQGVNLDARLSDLALLVTGFPGPVQLTGTFADNPQNFEMNLNGTGPGGTRVRVDGTVARDFSTANLQVAGNTDSAAVNPLLRTRSIEGPVTFDLRLNGRPSLEALSGRVELRGGRLAEPKLGLSIDDLNAVADLAGGRINLDVQGAVEAGGNLTLSGPISLVGGREINLDVGLRRVVLRDPTLYETEANGRLTVSGSLSSGVVIAGRVDVGETELRIPSTGFGGAASIPAIKHLYDRPPVRATRAKAGLIGYPSPESAAAGMTGPAATPGNNPPRLDLVISAPRQIFVRGRGVDAELGGEIRVTGTSRQVIPVGQLELIRGRVDLLGKRFDLTEGLIELQGSMIPVIRLVAETDQDGITTRIIIDGEARDPEIQFQSDPDMPEEEVLSHLLFGRGLDNISALQAAQLANAIAVLAGKGGEGIVGRLRAATGLDDLDLATDDQGNVSVRAGKYLSKNLYTDVQVGGDGTTQINLNLDLSRSLTARGSVNSEGDSTLGIYYERDY